MIICEILLFILIFLIWELFKIHQDWDRRFKCVSKVDAEHKLN